MAELSGEGLNTWDYHSDLTDISHLIPPYRPPTPTNASIKSSNLSKPSFLRLSPEIRLRIYSFCLVNPSPIVVWSDGNTTYSGDGYREGLLN